MLELVGFALWCFRGFRSIPWSVQMEYVGPAGGVRGGEFDVVGVDPGVVAYRFLEVKSRRVDSSMLGETVQRVDQVYPAPACFTISVLAFEFTRDSVSRAKFIPCELIRVDRESLRLPVEYGLSEFYVMVERCIGRLYESVGFLNGCVFAPEGVRESILDMAEELAARLIDYGDIRLAAAFLRLYLIYRVFGWQGEGLSLLPLLFSWLLVGGGIEEFPGAVRVLRDELSSYVEGVWPKREISLIGDVENESKMCIRFLKEYLGRMSRKYGLEGKLDIDIFMEASPGSLRLEPAFVGGEEPYILVGMDIDNPDIGVMLEQLGCNLGRCRFVLASKSHLVLGRLEDKLGLPIRDKIAPLGGSFKGRSVVLTKFPKMEVFRVGREASKIVVVWKKEKAVEVLRRSGGIEWFTIERSS